MLLERRSSQAYSLKGVYVYRMMEWKPSDDWQMYERRKNDDALGLALAWASDKGYTARYNQLSHQIVTAHTGITTATVIAKCFRLCAGTKLPPI